MIRKQLMIIACLLITFNFALFACTGGSSSLRQAMSKSFLVISSNVFYANGKPKTSNEVSPKLISKLNSKYSETMEDLRELHKVNSETISYLFKRPIEKDIKAKVSITIDDLSYVNVDSDGKISISIATVQSSLLSAMLYSANFRNYDKNKNIMLDYLNINGFKPPLTNEEAIKSLSSLSNYIESLSAEADNSYLKQFTIDKLWAGVVVPVGLCFFGQRIFMLAHELGHIALDHHKWPQNCETLKYMEIEADTYAAILVSMHFAKFISKLESYVNPNEKFAFSYQLNELVNLFSMLGHDVFFNLTYEIMGLKNAEAYDTCGYPDVKMRADHISDVITLFFSPQPSDIHFSLKSAYNEIHKIECKKGN